MPTWVEIAPRLRDTDTRLALRDLRNLLADEDYHHANEARAIRRVCDALNEALDDEGE